MKNARFAPWIVMASLLAGVILSSYYLYHQWFPETGGLCAISESVNCSASSASAFARILNIPIALLGLGFYIGGFFMVRTPSEDDEAAAASAPAPMLQSLFLIGVVYSVFLAVMTAIFIQTLCPVCTLMWITNVVGLLAVRAWTGRPLLRTLMGQFRAFPLSFWSLASGFLPAFVVVVSGGIYVERYIVGVAPLEVPDPVMSAEELGDFGRVRRPGGAGIGPVDAPIVIVEFSDFQCPYCKRFSESLHQLKQELGDDLRLEFRHFPLSIHDYADDAALAAICASDLDLFWELHDELFELNVALSTEGIIEAGEYLGIPAEDLAACMNNELTQQELEEDQALAHELGVRGTPFFIINGVGYAGGFPIEILRAIVERHRPD
jgi:uncharacterized membrane protein/thiol-disulfide isomerase/thioredoxin